MSPRKPRYSRTPGEALNTARTNLGAILDITPRARDYAAVRELLSPQWREVSTEGNVGVFKLQDPGGGGKTIDKVLRHYPIKRMGVLLLTSMLGSVSMFAMMMAMHLFWRFDYWQSEGRRGYRYVLVNPTRP